MGKLTKNKEGPKDIKKHNSKIKTDFLQWI